MGYPNTFELAATDRMTGLATADYFRHLLREELLPRARESDGPLSLFLFDLDDFLAINQRHGRGGGDAVLTRVAGALTEALPETAVLTRYGGDEFGGALPDTRLDDAFTLLEELRRRVGSLEFEGLPGVRITCSIGLAAFPIHGQTDAELMRQAGRGSLHREGERAEQGRAAPRGQPDGHEDELLHSDPAREAVEAREDARAERGEHPARGARRRAEEVQRSAGRPTRTVNSSHRLQLRQSRRKHTL